MMPMKVSGAPSDENPSESDQQVPVKSIHCNRAVVKSGTSAAVNITKEVAAMGLSVGDPVNIRLVRPSVATDYQNEILDLVDQSKYSIINADWVIKKDASIILSDAEKDRMRRYNVLYHLYRDTVSTLNDYIQLYCDGRILRYDSELNTFVYTTPTGSIPFRPLFPLSTKLQIDNCTTYLSFLRDLTEKMDNLHSPLKITDDLNESIKDTFNACADVLHSDDMDVHIRELNAIRNAKQEAVLQVEGNYVCYVFYNREGDSTTYFGYYIILANSKEDALKKLNDRELSVLIDDPDHEIDILRTVALGPFTYADAADFEKYCNIGIEINFKSFQLDNTIDWLVDQSENFRGSLKSRSNR